jgi:prepilin-type processing-associated H-X9-DG protein
MFSDRSNQKDIFNASGYWLPGAKSASDTPSSPGVYRVTYAFNHLIAQSDESPTSAPATLSAIPLVAGTALLGPSQNWFTWSTCRRGGSGTELLWNVSNPPAGSWAWGYEFWGGLDGGYSGGANFAFVDGHAEYSKITKGGDAASGAGSNGLYAGAFVKARTKPEATTTTTCPSDYGSGGSGY